MTLSASEMSPPPHFIADRGQDSGYATLVASPLFNPDEVILGFSIVGDPLVFSGSAPLPEHTPEMEATMLTAEDHPVDLPTLSTPPSSPNLQHSSNTPNDVDINPDDSLATDAEALFEAASVVDVNIFSPWMNIWHD